ncbi:MAG: cyclic nucleotide-binding domain-containing protein [Gammaproteobacteria bacterium]
MKTKIQSSGMTDPGRSRTKNDDCFLIDAALGLFIVCDGVSGQSGASDASQIASAMVYQYWKNQSNYLQESSATLTFPSGESSEALRAKLRECLEESVARASFQIFKVGQNDPSRFGMATTIEVALVIGNFIFVAHVGDSRTYLIRGGHLYQVTNDHSYVNEMVQSGRMSQEEAAQSPYANVLTRALGAKSAVAVDVVDIELAPGDSFLLCTDGLYRYFTQQDFIDCFANESAETLAATFTQQANARGGQDNITAITLKIEFEDPDRHQRIMEKVETVKTFPLFSYLSSNELMEILSLASVREYKKGEVIVKEGDAADQFFIIVAGSADVVKDDQCVARREKGDSIGEMGWVDYSPRSATVICVQDSRLLVFPRDSLYRLFKKESKLAVKFFWSLCRSLNDRLRGATKRIAVVQKSLEKHHEVPLPFFIPEENGSDQETRKKFV